MNLLSLVLVGVGLVAQTKSMPKTAHNPLAPLWNYQGTWIVTRSGAKTVDHLVNECTQVGNYFACEQVVNDKSNGLLIVVPTDQPNQFHTQMIQPSGRATGLNDLEIAGDRWTFSSRWNDGGKVTYYRTINIFTGKTKIHFEQAESPDGKNWTTTNSGDETKVGGGR
jgi:hypothetical protein